MKTTLFRGFDAYYFTLSISSIMVCLSGCTSYLYSPNQHNIPAFKEKNEVRLSGSYHLASNMEGFQIQAAYAPARKLGIQAGACFINPRNIYNRSLLYEAGVGYFKPLPHKRDISKQYWVFEFYGLMGFGEAWKSYYRVNLFKPYVQPSISIVHDIADLSLSMKVGVLHTFNIQHSADTTMYSEGTAYQYNLIVNHRSPFFLEPAVNLRFGFKYVKAQCQLSYSIMGSPFREHNAQLSVQAGLIFSFAPRFHKPKASRTIRKEF